MATGIVSTALTDDGLPFASDALLAIGVIGYVGLVAVSGWRLVRWPQRMLADVVSSREFAFLAAQLVQPSGLFGIQTVGGCGGVLA